ncbi:TRAP transporter large permease subunit [Roseomonas alkaliterrae]|uniref:TRAP transporter large permease protein n=1 Tax=Neoroseomonas alkaliterrae TaxID=1452450 RepID=A0A840Y7F0_9PROT|nr:TRAP transporter large permease subunit [Neoroseomonas alkaliterrae]MBB5690502.1 tripartite ATP-independent transporter DctM subunit [Neoroseomonas alkaliterrae]MBR0677454.1 TRAP transporter large permease subunit [Neoroseomonas alkaliterrae]
MSDPVLGMVMLGSFIVVILLGFPVAFTLMAMGIGFGYLSLEMRVFDLLVQRTYAVMANDVLISIPLFIFMGYVIERANILDRLFRALQLASGGLPGALAVATLATCAMFATATGIVGAVVTLMGLLAFPAMLRAGYDARLAAGVVCAGGCLGILIPPSIMFILYGATTGTSVARLYAAAFLPGLGLAALYMAYVMILALLRPSMAPKLPPEERDVPFGTVLLAVLTSFVPLAVLIMAVLGAILLGLATPSEAAAMGSAGAVLLAIAYRAFTFEKLKESVFLTARTTAMVCWLFVGAYIFTSVFGYLGGHHVVEKWFVEDLNLSPVTFLMVTQLIIFVLGWPLEWSEIVLIFVPIFLPLLDTFGIDPIFFGVLVGLNLQTSFMTPPVAMAAYYLKGVAPPQVKLGQIFAGCLPFVGIVVLAMTMLYIFPEIATWLPSYLYDTPQTGGSGADVLQAPSGGFQVDEEPQLPSLN